MHEVTDKNTNNKNKYYCFLQQAHARKDESYWTKTYKTSRAHALTLPLQTVSAFNVLTRMLDGLGHHRALHLQIYNMRIIRPTELRCVLKHTHTHNRHNRAAMRSDTLSVSSSFSPSVVCKWQETCSWTHRVFMFDWNLPWLGTWKASLRSGRASHDSSDDQVCRSTWTQETFQILHFGPQHHFTSCSTRSYWRKLQLTHKHFWKDKGLEKCFLNRNRSDLLECRRFDVDNDVTRSYHSNICRGTRGKQHSCMKSVYFIFNHTYNITGEN